MHWNSGNWGKFQKNRLLALQGGDWKVLKRCGYKALIRCAYKVLRSSIRRSYILLTCAYKVLYSKNRENKVLRSKMVGDYSHPLYH